MKFMDLISSWSGGKDSCFALMRSLQEGHQLKALLNMMNENGKISRSHGLTKAILQQQADAIGVPIIGISATWKAYEEQYINALKTIKKGHNTNAVVFGDIDLEPHREWEEKVCKASNHEALLPLWQQSRRELVFAMIDAGINAIIVSCNTDLGEGFLGRTVSRELVKELEDLGIDACGENGEYHTCVVDCPLFTSPIILPDYKKVTHENYCFINWIEE